MADDVLVAKLFKYICVSGGFVDLGLLLNPSSPLCSKKTKLEAKEWLKTQGPEVGFVCVKDRNDEITGVRIDLKKKICHQYAVKGSCGRAQGKCKYWHICKSHIEGICDGKCGLSHNFLSDDNQRMVKELGLEKHSNETLRNIVAWSLPQVCQLYLRNQQCKCDKCPYLHICSQAVQGSLCKCILSHKLSDSHNVRILKQYDLIPPHQVMYINFIQCSILVLNDQKCIETKKCVVNCTAGVAMHEATTAIVNNEKQDTGCSLCNTVVITKPGSKQDPPATLSLMASSAKKQDNGLKGKGLFECLCKEFNCSAPLVVLKNSKYVNEDASLFLEENNDKFLFTRDENDNIQNIVAFCPKLRLCFDFLFLNECKKEHCPSFHLCRDFITGSCSHGETCSSSHSFRNKRDQETVSKLDLDWLTNEQLRQLMLSSTPQVCINYNQGTCINDSTCCRIHICKDFVLNACQSGNACCFQHKEAFDTHHTRSLLEKFQMGKISHTNVLKTILVCEEQDRVLCSSKITQIQSEASLLMGMLDVQDSPISLQSSQQTKPSYPWNYDNKTDDETFSSQTSSASVTSCSPPEWEVFECLCKEYGSSASISEIAEHKGLFPHGLKNAELWFRKVKGSFLITEDTQGKIRQVHAFSAQARLCLDYSNNGKCDNQDCKYLHVCRDFITDSCSSGVTCPLNHQFHNQRDKALLSRSKLDQFTDLQLQMLVLSSTPRICVKYNNGVCKRGDSCTKIHMCCGYLRKCCSGEYECGLNHETAMDTEQTQAVLKRLLLDNVDKHDLLKMILDDKDSLSGKDKTKCHSHPDKPSACICSQYLIDRCYKGLRCENHHCSLPYHWQYKVSIFDEWKSFNEIDNLTLEKLYCDVNVETQVNFKPAQSLDVSFLERQESPSRHQGYDIMIDLDNMTITFQEPKSGGVVLVGQLRRLSTVSYATNPCDSVFTNWKWYWKDNDNIWQMYDKDFWDRDLQELIEQAFLDMLEQGKERATHKFTTSEHGYNLFFYSTREMYQVNLKTGTKSQVKRRPEKPVSREDMDKWARDDLAVKKRMEERALKSNNTSHWSLMPTNTQYTRVRLDASSAEFNDVEQLLRKTMNHLAVIESIERVQNPLLWEKYCRNKETMIAVAALNQHQVNEKSLFHGTSPRSVEAICANNFDPSLHRRYKFGKGTYFAVNASYSHYYASRDIDLSQFIFLAKVLVGSYTKGRSSYRRPPQKQPSNPESDRYDSCVDHNVNPTIFVVFDNNRFYPEYVIKYRSMGHPTVASYSSSPSKPRLPPSPLRRPSHRHALKASSPVGSATSSVNHRGEVSTPSGNSAKSHIHQDKPEAFICSQFLIGKCDNGLGCENHHCSLPYHWQYKGFHIR
ncbi:uncharacterized protein LOC144661949 isoform X2 [Oculina patagonica]